ncbi:MAG TPA: hypothetical protein IAB23_12775 [Candidatus Scybalocola faecavium]|nr:hypothetical protein [Candidatus Scybalocola faecavium]
MRIKNRNFETFNDGNLVICQAQNRVILADKARLRYGNKTVGYKRDMEAKVIHEHIDKMVAVPMSGHVTAMDVVLIGDVQYEILSIQEKFDSRPPCLYLTLKKVPVMWKDKRNEG